MKRITILRLSLILPFFVLLSGCDWKQCVLEDGLFGIGFECTSFTQPLFHDRPEDDRSIDIAAKRIKAKSGRTHNQLWLIEGGPGYSGTQDFSSFMWNLHRKDELKDFDIYTLDHRGVGKSSPLQCEPEEDVNQCIQRLHTQLGDALSAYNTTQSAHDLAALIQQTKKEGQRVFLWGGSYGSYLIQRFVNLYPALADGVVLQEIANPDLDFSQWDKSFNDVAKKLFAECDNNEGCAEKLGGDAWGMLDDVMNQIAQGHCADSGIDVKTAKHGLAILMYSPSLRNVIPALVYRLNRCSQDDIIAIRDHLIPKVIASGEVKGFSEALQHHVILSEMWQYDLPPTVDEMQAVFDHSLVSLGNGIEFARGYDNWPRYERDLYDDQAMQYDGPLLMMQGGLDPATPYSNVSDFSDRYQAPHQTFVYFPNSTHNVLISTPMKGSNENCGMKILLQFLPAPDKAIDESCVDEVQPINFTISDDLSTQLFGTTNLWGDGGSQ